MLVKKLQLGGLIKLEDIRINRKRRRYKERLKLLTDKIAEKSLKLR